MRLFLPILLLLNSTVFFCTAQNVGIGTTLPDPSAKLEIRSGNSGLLIPRLTSTQRTAIAGPAKGLMVYDSTLNTFYFHDGSSWQSFSNPGSAGWSANQHDLYNTNTGNVGIGISTPFSKLDITTPDANWGLTHSNGSVRVGTYAGSGGGWVATQSNTPLYFATSLLNTNFSAQMTLTTDGKLGIGTIYPLNSLDVVTPDASWGMTHSNGSVRVGTYAGSGGGWIATQSYSPLYFATSLGNANNYAQMTLTTNGNLGIGNLSPFCRLDVSTADASWGMTHSSGSGIRVGTYAGSGGGWIATQSNSPLYFATGLGNTNNYAQMVLTPGGTLGIGDNSPNGAYRLVVNGSITSNADIVAANHLTSLNDVVLYGRVVMGLNGIGDTWSISEDPGITFSTGAHELAFFYNSSERSFIKPEDGSWNQLSDRSLKKDFQEMGPVLADALRLRPYHYHFKEVASDAPLSTGFIAQDVQEIFPELVQTTYTREGRTLLALNYQGFSVIAIKAIQEQQELIDGQKQQIAALLNGIDALKQTVDELTQKMNKLEAAVDPAHAGTVARNQ